MSLRNVFRRFFGRHDNTITRHRPRKTQRSRLSIESLETRDLMAASLTASFSGGVLRIEGTNQADQVRVVQTSGQIAVDGITIQSGSNVSSVAASAVARVVAPAPVATRRRRRSNADRIEAGLAPSSGADPRTPTRGAGSARTAGPARR